MKPDTTGLRGRVALVTGAGRGLGEIMARALAEHTLASADAHKWIPDGIAYLRSITPEQSEASSARLLEMIRGLAGGEYDALSGCYLEIVDVSEDGRTAWLRARCIMQAGYHESVESLVPEMPRSCWEGGIHANTYVKEDGVWKIKVLDYNMLWQADHAKGWGAGSVHLQPLEKTFPEDPNGPDELKPESPPVWPRTRHVPYHYEHPVNGWPIPY